MNNSQSTELETIAHWALQCAAEVYPPYYHRFAPKVYRLPQLIACLVLKVYLHQDYRGCEQLLKISPPLQKALGLKRVPDYSTISRASKKITQQKVDAMLSDILRRTGIQQAEVAVDSTGFQKGTASTYYQSRRKHSPRRWTKLSAAVLIPSLLLGHSQAAMGRSNDMGEFLATIKPVVEELNITALYADAGYDAEWVHRWCREEQGIESWIPPRKLPILKGTRPKGKWRRLMVEGLPKEYGRRWAAETVNSVIKRKWGGATSARSQAARRQEVLLKSVVYAIHR